MTGDRAPVSGSPAALAETVQRAAGVLAARRRGDLGDAETLLVSLGDEAAWAAAFFVLAELSLALLSENNGQSWEECLHDLTLSIAAVAAHADRP